MCDEHVYGPEISENEHSSCGCTLQYPGKHDLYRSSKFYLQLHTTQICNLRCAHCYHESYGKTSDSASTMPAVDVNRLLLAYRSFLDKRGDIGTVYFTGGEPLLDPNLCTYIKQARELQIFPRVLSNGTMLTTKLAQKLVEAGIGVLQVSLDGLEQTHDSIRGAGAFKKATYALDLCRACTPSIVTSVMCTLSKRNAKELPELIRHCIDHEVVRFAVGRLVPTGIGQNLEQDSLSPEELREAFSKLHQLKMMYQNQIDFVTKDPLWMQFIGMKKIIGCSAGQQGLCVIHNGDILPCRRMNYIIGNIRDCNLDFEAALWKAWESPDVKHLRSRDNFTGNCGRCERLHQCGGCRAIAYSGAEHSIFAGDSSCWYFPNTTKWWTDW